MVPLFNEQNGLPNSKYLGKKIMQLYRIHKKLEKNLPRLAGTLYIHDRVYQVFLAENPKGVSELVHMQRMQTEVLCLTG
jgi:hypothetical protein